MSNQTKRIEKLQARVQPVDPRDAMSEAGRKVLLEGFIKMLEHEAGSRTGTDSEDVHQMRVATRRMRSLLKLLRPYFKKNTLEAYRQQLAIIADTLGAVRDLDVLLVDMRRYQATLAESQQADLQPFIDKLEKRNAKARRNLLKLLDGKAYRRFLNDYGDFLSSEGASAKKLPSDRIVPYQVRHILPVLIQERLAAVRAYDDAVIAGENEEDLHALRIEFKKLRYTISFFEPILGKEIAVYLSGVKAFQDLLGRLNDIAVAHQRRATFLSASDRPYAILLEQYFAGIDDERSALLGQFPALWQQFNARKVQQKLTTALLALR